MVTQFGLSEPVTHRPFLVFHSILATSDSAFKLMQLHVQSSLSLPQKLRLRPRPAILLGKPNPEKPPMIDPTSPHLKKSPNKAVLLFKKTKVMVPGAETVQNNPRAVNLAAPPLSNGHSFPPAVYQPQTQAGSSESHSKQRKTQLEQQLLMTQQQNQSQSLQIQALMEQIANLTTQLQGLAAMQTSVPHEEDDSL